MAYNLLCTLSFLSCVLLFTSTFQTSVNSVPLPLNSSEKVSLSIYYQSIGNAEFMSMYVPLIFETGLISIVDLHFSPWGNSHVLENKTIVCQDGEKECFLNTIEACAINTWPDLVEHFSFIACVERMVDKGLLSEWKDCFELFKLDSAPIKKCYDSGYGEELEKKYADETAALEPPHYFTPWVVLNGKPIEDIGNTMTYICKAYKGPSPPEVCKRSPMTTSPSVKSRNFRKVSYRDNATKAKKFTRSKMIIA